MIGIGFMFHYGLPFIFFMSPKSFDSNNYQKGKRMFRMISLFLTWRISVLYLLYIYYFLFYSITTRNSCLFRIHFVFRCTYRIATERISYKSVGLECLSTKNNIVHYYDVIKYKNWLNRWIIYTSSILLIFCIHDLHRK